MPHSNLQKIYQEIFARVDGAKELKKIRIDDLGEKDFVLSEDLAALSHEVVSEITDKYQELLPSEVSHLFNVALVKKVCDELNGRAYLDHQDREEQIEKFERLFGTENLKLLIAHDVLSRDLVDGTKYSELLAELPAVDFDLTQMELSNRSQNEERKLVEAGPFATFNITKVPKPYAILHDNNGGILVIGAYGTSEYPRAILVKPMSVTNGAEGDGSGFISTDSTAVISVASQAIKYDQANNLCLVACAQKVIFGYAPSTGSIGVVLNQYRMNSDAFKTGGIWSNKNRALKDLSSVTSAEVTDSGYFIHFQFNNGTHAVQHSFSCYWITHTFPYSAKSNK